MANSNEIHRLESYANDQSIELDYGKKCPNPNYHAMKWKELNENPKLEKKKPRKTIGPIECVLI